MTQGSTAVWESKTLKTFWSDQRNKSKEKAHRVPKRTTKTIKNNKKRRVWVAKKINRDFTESESDQF